MQAGDHIYVSRLGGIYAHHGIYFGDDEFIHFNGPNWLQASVHRVSPDDFARGDAVQVRDYDEFHQELSLLDAGAVASYVHGSGLEGPSAAVSTG